MESVLEVKNLKYKDVLKNITFSLEENTFNILIGSNGSGKTTIVNCIRGLLKYEGYISLFGVKLDHKQISSYHKIGFFTEQTIVLEENLFDELLNMLMNLNYEEEKAKRRIFAVAKKFEITDILYKDKNNLSTHDLILISFIFSIIHEPKILIIDNDLENVDQNTKNKIFEYLEKQKKLTVLFICNNSEYFYKADNLLFLNEGKIVLNGTMDEVIHNEKTFINCGSKLPFMIDLSNKLMVYELLDKTEFDIEKMVNKIWK